MKGGFGCSPCCGEECLKADPNGTEQVASTTWWAQSFVTPGGGLTLYSVTVYIEGPYAGVIDNWALDLYTDNGASAPEDSHPDALEESLTSTASINPSGVTLLTWDSVGTPLTGNTRYWIVLRAVDLAYSMLWQHALFLNDACGKSPRGLSIDSGASWELPAEVSAPFKFYLN